MRPKNLLTAQSGGIPTHYDVPSFRRKPCRRPGSIGVQGELPCPVLLSKDGKTIAASLDFGRLRSRRWLVCACLLGTLGGCPQARSPAAGAVGGPPVGRGDAAGDPAGYGPTDRGGQEPVSYVYSNVRRLGGVRSGGRGYLVRNKAGALDVEAAREEAISFAAYRVLSARFAASPSVGEIQPLLDELMDIARLRSQQYLDDRATCRLPWATASLPR